MYRTCLWCVIFNSRRRGLRDEKINIVENVSVNNMACFFFFVLFVRTPGEYSITIYYDVFTVSYYSYCWKIENPRKKISLIFLVFPTPLSAAKRKYNEIHRFSVIKIYSSYRHRAAFVIHTIILSRQDKHDVTRLWNIFQYDFKNEQLRKCPCVLRL